MALTAERLPMYARYGMVEDWPVGKEVPPNPVQRSLKSDIPMFVRDRSFLGGYRDRVLVGTKPPLLTGSFQDGPCFRSNGAVAGSIYERNYAPWAPPGDFTVTIGYAPFNSALSTVAGFGTYGPGTTGWQVLNNVTQDAAAIWSTDGTNVGLVVGTPFGTITNHLSVVSFGLDTAGGYGFISENGRLANYAAGPAGPVYKMNGFCGIGSDGALTSFSAVAITYFCIHHRLLTLQETWTLHNFIAQWGWNGGEQYVLP